MHDRTLYEREPREFLWTREEEFLLAGLSDSPRGDTEVHLAGTYESLGFV